MFFIDLNIFCVKEHPTENALCRLLEEANCENGLSVIHTKEKIISYGRMKTEFFKNARVVPR